MRITKTFNPIIGKCSRTKMKGDKMHRCKTIEHTLNKVIEIVEICEKDCNELDWKYLQDIKQQLFVLKSITDRWNREHTSWRHKTFYTPNTLAGKRQDARLPNT